MLNIFQKTINKPVSFEGIGLHTGKTSTVKILPSAENQGIIFKRVDLKENNLIDAKYTNVTSSNLCTTLENKFQVKVSTVEHLLAALSILGIDNAIIEVNNEEIPIMDGSSKNFLDILKIVGTKELKTKKKYIKINKEINFNYEDKEITIEPSSSFKIDFELNYENKIVGNQKNLVDIFNDNLENIYTSRTFCLLEDVEKIKKIGLAKGGSLENAVVISDKKVLNKGGLRNEKEFVNHKILDLVGDFFLSGYNFLGKVKCFKGGHQLSNLFLRQLFEKNNEKFEFIELNVNKGDNISKVSYKNNITSIAANA